MRRSILGCSFGLLLLLASCLTPPPLGVVEGEATTAGGTVVVGAEATLVPVGAVAPEGGRSTGTDAAGAFRFERVPPGVYGLTVVSDAEGVGAYAPELSVVQDQVTSVSLTLAPLGSVTVTVDVSDRGSRPARELVIDAFLVGTPIQARADPAGLVLLEGVPEGTYELSLRSAGYESASFDVAVTAGETLVLDGPIVLQRLAPYAEFGFSQAGNTVYVDASASFDVDGGALRYAWEFGDGGSATGVTTSHTYFSGGAHTIRLTVTDDAGNSDSVTREVTVQTPSVPAGGRPGAIVAQPVLAPGQVAEFEVHPAVAGDLLYLEAPAGGYIEATQGNATYYSSTPDRFSRGSMFDDVAAARLEPQAVRINVACGGPCVIVPADGGPALVRFANPGSSTAVMSLIAFVDAFADGNEPNDGVSSATPLADEQEGAIELVGDQDVFRVERPGRLIFSNPPNTIRLQAQVYAANGSTRQRTLADGESMLVTAGQYVVVAALGETAAPSARSFYFLTLE